MVMECGLFRLKNNNSGASSRELLSNDEFISSSITYFLFLVLSTETDGI